MHRNTVIAERDNTKPSREIHSPLLSKTKQVQSIINIRKNKNDSDNSDKLFTKFNIEDRRLNHGVVLPELQLEEAEFLILVSEDNIDCVQIHVKQHPSLDVNCVNFEGMSALHIAVQNRSEAMVEFLLKYPNIDIGDNALRAIRNNSLKILVILLEGLKKVSPGLEYSGAPNSRDYPAYVTPLHLACQLGHYEIVNLLIKRGHILIPPHNLSCSCIKCNHLQVRKDFLYASNARLSLYRAISSPVYMVHVSPDPILAAFYLTAELSENALAYRHLATAYLKLRDDVSAFAVDLIGCCRTSEEVELILKQTSGYRKQRHFALPRLFMAVDYKQKEFVAHPNTQEVLESYWLGEWYNWRKKSCLKKAILVSSRVFLTPIILFMCMVAPQHRLVRYCQIPLNKLITHASAYIVFLALVFYISNQDKTGQKRGPPNTGAEGPVILYVCGYTWSAIRMCFIQRPRRYFALMWNWAEIIMLLLFGLTFTLWIAAAMDVASNEREELDRKYWNQYDPTLLAEGSFCLATIFAFFRLMFLCQLNYHLGPLQVCLGKMTIDICKYVIVFAILISAFAAGLARFYQYYDGMVNEDEFGMKTVQVSSFTSLTDTLKTLFWALFCMAPLESADVVLENTRTVVKSHENRHEYTERIGYFCFGCFEVISVIIVLNMLIATMSNTFQRVTDNVEIEWTFGRTEVYIDYMCQTTLPSPFNMIPTASGIANFVEWFSATVFRPDTEANVREEYDALMSVIVQRYFSNKRKTNNKYTLAAAIPVK